jgi:hypothetical protein
MTLARACAVAALLGAATPAGLEQSTVPGGAHTRSPERPASSPRHREFVEHRYRILGKVRLAVFWMTRDNVGGARMSWRSDGASTSVALLAGSDPDRAPRSLNQWAYVREELRPDEAEVFTLHSLDKHQSDPQGPIGGGGAGPAFGVSCSSMRDGDVSSAITTVDGGGVTYRMFDRLLDEIAAVDRWQHQRTTRPAGAQAGFLMALEQAMHITGKEAASAGPLQPVAYVYRNKIYDLSVRDRKRLGRTTIGARTFEELIRTDFSVRNRATGDISKFGVTHEPGTPGVSLPVQIFYQPSFWLSIELRLDDAADVPADPAEDSVLLTRIHGICGAVAPVESNRD